MSESVRLFEPKDAIEGKGEGAGDKKDQSSSFDFAKMLHQNQENRIVIVFRNKVFFFTKKLHVVHIFLCIKVFFQVQLWHNDSEEEDETGTVQKDKFMCKSSATIVITNICKSLLPLAL